ncbi:hypothetical protein [uncultured Chitinophaga sp.]|uniref:hypothetical protein n=1 Tax=uncultured Chitinophaga sp. TaxID=339340 RepID=UPI0025DE6C05|nr:hypothetical protein [uncultured Chitinophaga sp.]
MANVHVYPGNRLMVRRSPTFIKAILLSGIAASLLQLTGMFLISWLARGRSPADVLQFIASGINGEHAYSDGITSVLAGLFLHCMFALVVATVYLLAYSWTPFVRNHPFKSGMLYGVIVWLFMNGAVIPLSHVPLQQPDPLMASLSLAVDVFFAGLPVALVTQYCFYAHKRHVPDITELIWHT